MHFIFGSLLVVTSLVFAGAPALAAAPTRADVVFYAGLVILAMCFKD